MALIQADREMEIQRSVERGGVWVFAEQRDGKLLRVGFELLGAGRKLATRHETNLVALLMGVEVDGLEDELIAHGADTVLTIKDPLLVPFQTDVFATVLADLASLFEPEIFLLGATTFGRDLAPRVAAILRTGLTSDCVELDIDLHRHLVAIVPALGGNLFAKVVCPVHRPQIATVRPGVMRPLDRDPMRQGTIHQFLPKMGSEILKVRIVERFKGTSEERPLEEADIVFSVGYGVRTTENFYAVKKLAQLLGGAIGGTRPAVDAAWISEDLMIGQSGKTIRPKLYVGIGVSGMIQHIVGVLEAETIVAINRDKNAPIFEIADYGIVGDVQQIIPTLIKGLEGEKEKTF